MTLFIVKLVQLLLWGCWTAKQTQRKETLVGICHASAERPVTDMMREVLCQSMKGWRFCEIIFPVFLYGSRVTPRYAGTGVQRDPCEVRFTVCRFYSVKCW